MITKEEELKKIGSRFEKLRKLNGYSSYEDFAIKHEISRMQYWRIEKGITNLRIDSIIKILNIHGVTLEDFFADNF